MNSSNPSFGDDESTCKNTAFAGADVENTTQNPKHHHNSVRVAPALVINDVAQVIANLEVHHAQCGGGSDGWGIFKSHSTQT